MSLFSDDFQEAPATEANVDLENLVEEEMLTEEINDIDPNTEFGLQYMDEFVNIPVASYSNSSIKQAIDDNKANLGLPSDLSKLRITEGGVRYLNTEALEQPPQLGMVYVLSIGHDSKASY